MSVHVLLSFKGSACIDILENRCLGFKSAGLARQDMGHTTEPLNQDM